MEKPCLCYMKQYQQLYGREESGGQPQKKKWDTEWNLGKREHKQESEFLVELSRTKGSLSFM